MIVSPRAGILLVFVSCAVAVPPPRRCAAQFAVSAVVKAVLEALFDSDARPAAAIAGRGAVRIEWSLLRGSR